MKISLFVLLLTSSCFAFEWQSHRGARGLYPENTINGMKKALAYPEVTTLELDVVVSKDNRVIVSHEPWFSQEICLDPLGKFIDGKGHKIYRMDYKQIKKYDCGSKVHPKFPKQEKIVERKPTLKDLLFTVEDYRRSNKRNEVSYSIEIKSSFRLERKGYQPAYQEMTDLVIDTIKKSGIPLEKFYIQSFDWRVLQYLDLKYPIFKKVALIQGRYNYKKVLDKLGFSPWVFSPHYSKVTKEQVDYFRKKGVRVIPWTVNNVKEMKKLKALGVDGIITDYPNLISKVN